MTMIWAFKILAVPVLVALATLAIRRWGARAGGLLMGLPLMTGPISFLLAIEQGTAFAAKASVGILLAVAAMGPYALASYWTAMRLPWPACMAAALAAFAVASLALQGLSIDLRQAGALAGASLLAALLMMPRIRTPLVAPPPRWWDIWLRMLVTAVLVVTVTVLAHDLGPHLSGILSTLPIISTVVVSFSLQQAGPAMARAVIRANATTMLSFIAFFVVVAETIETHGIGMAYALAVAVTAGMSLTIALVDRRLARPLEQHSAPITKALE
jgi:hypothetical protein